MNDTISRQAALDAIGEEPTVWNVDDDITIGERAQWRADVLAIKTLPAAKSEIVCCKDCKWWDEKEGSSYGYCHAAKHSHYSRHWEIIIYRTYGADFYCADAELREEEEEEEEES